MIAVPAPGLIGESPAIERLRRMIRKLGRSRAAVLLIGETGTGKEVVARAIHEARATAGGFVPIDCGAIVGPLMESELFGHVKGAFTGAAESRRGLLEAAEGGTAFFDEIGDLPLELQAKLLRLLQEREFRPVGSSKYRQVTLNVVAATHRDLAEAVRQGRFREALYYRLSVVKLRLPPLRERPGDVRLLIDHFMKLGDCRFRITPEVEAALLAYPWPGNVRELKNCIERIAAITSGPEVQWSDLPTALQQAAASQGAEIPAAAFSLDLSEKRAILQALEFTGGHRGKAAQLLGIGRVTLYRKLKQYRIRS